MSGTRGWLIAASVAVLLVAGSIFVRWPLDYRQDAIQARVIDSQTEEPIAGAAVVAVWQASHGGPEETWTVFRYDETITDRNGRFTFPAWKKRRGRRDGYLKDQDPILTIFKPGYHGLELDNRVAYVKVVGLRGKDGETVWTPVTTPDPGQIVERYPGWRWGGTKRYCFWNGKLIGLKRAVTLEDEEHAVSAFGSSFGLLELSRGVRLTTFWSVWREARDRLPFEVRSKIPFRTAMRM